jgi:glycosyltransferase involved in cell wall biosynthesis
MPVYNGEKFISEALDSLLAQTFTDFELIISDKASTDDTEEQLARPRIILEPAPIVTQHS